MSKIAAQPKEKVSFPCCNILALGFRGAHRIDGEIFNYAQCPRCGKRLNVSKWVKP